MNGLDIAILCILGFTLVRGIMTGLVQSVSGLIGAVAGFYAAYFYYPALADFLKKWVEPGSALNIASFFVIFCAVVIVVTLIGRMLKWIMKIVFLGWVDRLGGGLIGLLKGCIVVSALVIVLTTFLPPKSPVLKNSTILPYVSEVSELMMELVPSDFKGDAFKINMDSLKKLKEKAEEKLKK
ncbi:MAG: CvpA family protein [Desulfobacteraceae bacterium]|nr:CvpA family protein [Desulfobacteraceae bacterium]